MLCKVSIYHPQRPPYQSLASASIADSTPNHAASTSSHTAARFGATIDLTCISNAEDMGR